MSALLEKSSAEFRLFPPTSSWSRLSRGGLLLGAGLVCLPVFSAFTASSLPAATASSKLSRQSFVAEAVARSGPAVVTLETQRTIRSLGTTGVPQGLLMDPLFQHFFGQSGRVAPRSRIERGQGSGVIFSTTGLVLTNAHVVEKSDQLMVGLPDGRRVSARLVGQDAITDLAVVQLDGQGPWPSAPLGDSDQLQVGDWAIAVGNPFGLENTVTLGIISNLNRNVSQLGISGKRLDLIQTDAAINPGNSGGPLLNAEGNVVGINTLVRSGPGAGLGFAIPINRAIVIAKQLVERGWASHPIVGVGLSSVPLSQPGTSGSAGAVIRSLVPGGPAAIAGLKVNDVIVSVKGQPITGPAEVVTAIDNHGAGRPLKLGLIRGNNQIELTVIPIELKAMQTP
ncbi:MAG: trypsin-like peptidase domain-containing protein [Prochlorococcaceae cyanobacterium ETNP18_MAG_14]|nr:trypsin-like peptidase domain-containing protein [Prochlorococcaceae cyanobacterium ETNP18_MAG_14]